VAQEAAHRSLLPVAVGGIFRHVRDLTEAQVAAGHKVGIVCDSTTGGDYEAAIRPDGRTAGARSCTARRCSATSAPATSPPPGEHTRIIKNCSRMFCTGTAPRVASIRALFGSLLRVSRSRVARFYSPHGGSLHYDADTLTG
jgi:hypothetical protein